MRGGGSGVWVGVVRGGGGDGGSTGFLSETASSSYIYIMFTRGKLGYRLCAPRCVLVLLSYGVQEQMRLSTHTHTHTQTYTHTHTHTHTAVCVSVDFPKNVATVTQPGPG